MRQAERQQRRDELQEMQVGALQRLATVLETPARERRERELEAAFPEMFSIFAGERGVKTLLRLGGCARLWEKTVPETHLATVCDVADRHEWPLVKCVCGAATVVAADELPVACAGDCGRWFLGLGANVCVHHFKEIEE
jgi:hypothetical protein